jgi:hypothetical protein
VNLGPHAALGIDEPEFSELAHEVADLRPGFSDHARQYFESDL